MKNKVLIIDDDEEICEELSETLENEGYQVETVFDGLKASSLIDKAEYKLILLDLKLPNLSGFDLLKMARKKKIPSKILILTGRPLLKKKECLKRLSDQAGREEKILKLADGIINKPFDVKSMLNKIKELLR
jgi:DNA-binding response OmpR family regulator